MIEVDETPAFADWLMALRDRSAKVKIIARIDRMRHGNEGDHASVGDGVWEFRIDFGPGYRVYYCWRGKRLVLLLCGGDKGSQARDIRRAKKLASAMPAGREN